MKKKYREYFKKYDDIPDNYMDRFHMMMDKMKFSKKDLEKLKIAVDKLLHKRWNKLEFVFYMTPKPTSRPRTTSFHRHFYVKDASDNNAIFKQFVEECKDLDFSITTPTKFYVTTYSEIPSSMSKIEKICAELKLLFHISRPDWDNLGKTYSDMVQGYFLLDDSLIVDGRVRKLHSSKPRIEIEIEFMDKYDCKYNKKKIENWKSIREIKDRVIDRDSII